LLLTILKEIENDDAHADHALHLVLRGDDAARREDTVGERILAKSPRA
jgi:hypothetical protein